MQGDIDSYLAPRFVMIEHVKMLSLTNNLVASLMPPTLCQSADDKSLGMSVGVFGTVL